MITLMAWSDLQHFESLCLCLLLPHLPHSLIVVVSSIRYYKDYVSFKAIRSNKVAIKHTKTTLKNYLQSYLNSAQTYSTRVSPSMQSLKQFHTKSPIASSTPTSTSASVATANKPPPSTICPATPQRMNGRHFNNNMMMAEQQHELNDGNGVVEDSFYEAEAKFSQLGRIERALSYYDNVNNGSNSNSNSGHSDYQSS